MDPFKMSVTLEKKRLGSEFFTRRHKETQWINCKDACFDVRN